LSLRSSGAVISCPLAALRSPEPVLTSSSRMSPGEFGYGDTGGAVAGHFRLEFQQGVNNPRV